MTSEIARAPYLVVFDFDKTIAMTSEPGPNKIGVVEAYDLAVGEVFGNKGLNIYKESGGLKNRAPTEVVYDLLKKDDGVLIENAKNFFKSQFLRLLSIMPENFDRDSFVTDGSVNLNDLLTWMLVTEKCSHMIEEIGKELPSGEMWPRPTKGFIDFYKLITEKRQDGFSLVTAVVSSGHREFIRKTFDVYGLDVPTYMVTDDDMRKVNLPVWRKVKPAPYLFAVVHHSFMKDQGINDSSRFDKSRMIYFGDDPNKDGLLAKNSRVYFGLYNELLGNSILKTNDGIEFGNWGSMSDLLIRNQSNLVNGRSWPEIINYAA